MLYFSRGRCWQCRGAAPNLFKTPFGPVPHVEVSVVSPHSVKGWADRQTYKQPAFISLSETWQQRAQLHRHTPLLPSVFPFYLSCHPTTLKRRHGGISRCAYIFLFLICWKEIVTFPPESVTA